ncbi:MAG: hypothetical protein KC733_09670, partial [Candidatus Omnitrophica bacterium]|nr:hypothetical protein [Candidatus Omnitrophota bacterium]
MKRQLLIIYSLGILLTGCAGLGTYNPATERNEFIFISTPEEVAMGRQIHNSLAKEYEFSKNQND